MRTIPGCCFMTTCWHMPLSLSAVFWPNTKPLLCPPALFSWLGFNRLFSIPHIENHLKRILFSRHWRFRENVTEYCTNIKKIVIEITMTIPVNIIKNSRNIVHTTKKQNAISMTLHSQDDLCLSREFSHKHTVKMACVYLDLSIISHAIFQCLCRHSLMRQNIKFIMCHLF